jgi:putative hydrolase of the HAD superfamily
MMCTLALPRLRIIMATPSSAPGEEGSPFRVPDIAYAHQDVADVDIDVLRPHPELGDLIARLPGRKYIFTNADAPYAERVLERLGLTHAFDAMHDIHALDYVPKPQPPAYTHMCAAHGIDPKRAMFVEDMARNLTPAKAIGMTTVWIDNGSEQGPGSDRDHIDFIINDLAAFLAGVLEQVETA